MARQPVLYHLLLIAKQTKAALGADTLDVVADRGYFSGEEILACEEDGITVILPKPQTSANRAKGRFVKGDFVYVAADDVYVCLAGERLNYRYSNQQKGLTLRRYWTSVCQSCALKDQCTTGKERRITRWQHEHVLDAVERRLDENPDAMRQRRKTGKSVSMGHPIPSTRDAARTENVSTQPGSQADIPGIIDEVGVSHICVYHPGRLIWVKACAPAL